MSKKRTRSTYLHLGRNAEGKIQVQATFTLHEQMLLVVFFAAVTSYVLWRFGAKLDGATVIEIVKLALQMK